MTKSKFIANLKKQKIAYSLDKGICTITDNQGYVYLSSRTSLPEDIHFNNQGTVYLISLTSLPEGIQFNNQGSVYLSSLTSWDETNAGNEYRNLYTVMQAGELKIKLGCFWGNEKQAIDAIKNEYKLSLIHI